MACHVCKWYHAYWFDNPLRRLIHPGRKLLGPYIGQGNTAIDLGCGMGHFSLALAELVGTDGRVISVDLQQQMLDITRKRARKKGLDGTITAHLVDGSSLNLEEQAEFALSFWMVHEVEDLGRFAREVWSNLKPGGRWLIAEPKMHVSSEAMQKSLQIIEQNGFELVERPKIRISHAAVLRKAGP